MLPSDTPDADAIITPARYWYYWYYFHAADTLIFHFDISRHDYWCRLADFHYFISAIIIDYIIDASH